MQASLVARSVLSLVALSLGGLALAGLVGGCGGGDQADQLSFVVAGERWRASAVSAVLDTMVEDDGTLEVALRVVASNDATGERVTFWSLSEEVEGTHPVRVFGSLAGFGGVAPGPVTNACSSNDPEAASGTLSIEEYDRERGLLAGSFIANVCAVGEPDTTATLGDGRFLVAL